jgi:hypothetical protein
MPFSTLTTLVAGDVVRASYLNQNKDNTDDHEDRIVDLEAATVGTGDVVGPASATDNAIARYDSTTGKLLQNSGITIADGAAGTLNGSNSGDVTLAGSPTYLTIVGQAITRALIDLASHITGRLPFANLTAATAASRLLGRGGSGGAGDWQEIAIGAGLSFSGTTLSSSGSGASALDDLTDVVITTPAANDTVQYNGSEFVNVVAPRFTRAGIGVAADASAKLKIVGQYGSTTVAAGNSGTSKTLDWDDGNTQLLTLTGDCTLTLSNPKDGFRYLIALKQDGTGTRLVTWPSAVKWQAGTAPTLSTAAGKVDVVTLIWVAALGASGNYLAAANTNYTPA